MNRFCEVCGMADMVLGDSSLYCRNCGAQSNQYIEEAFDADDAHIFNTTFVRERGTLRNAEQQQQPQSQPSGNALDEVDRLDDLADLFGGLHDQQDPIELTPEVFNGSAPFSVKTEDFYQSGGSQYGQEVDPTSRMSKDELAIAIRKSYLNGVQKILQLQLECLVKEFRATPLICGIAGPIWLRFVASTRVFEKAWAEEAVMIAEHREKIRRENQKRIPPADAPSNGDGAEGKRNRKRVRKQEIRKDRPGPRTSFGRHLSYVWLYALKERIPLSMTLAVSYLSCYIAREPILPTDIKTWAISGRLPYLAAFVEISNSAPHHIPNTVGEKQIFPMKPRLMFQPLRVPGARSVELLAGFVAERVGIQLPPVNFHGICALFFQDLGLPVEKLLPYACRLYEWYAPSGLFLSARRTELPTRVYVMAMLVITLKVLYSLDGRPALNENDIKCRVEAPHVLLTRSQAKRQACLEASVDEEQSSKPKNKTHGTQTPIMTSADDQFSAPEAQVSGKTKRARTISGQDREDDGEDRISGEISGLKSLKKSAGSREQQKDLGDTKELLEKLESRKAMSTVDFDEELSKYLEYCQNVLFAGNDCDPGMEPVLERFRGIYEKTVAKVENEPVVNLDDEEEEAPGESIGKTPMSKGVAPGRLDRGASPEMDAQSAGSSRTDWRNRVEATKQQKEHKGKEKVLHTQNQEPPSTSGLDEETIERRKTSSVIVNMTKCGFSCLPPLEFEVGCDEYVRYNFQDPGEELIPVHEDYFRVLQACGKLISVHPKALHRCVQRIERGLVQMESNVEQFLLGEKNPDVIESAKSVKRRNPQRRRDKIGVATFRAEASKHVKDLSYL